ncbi:MAG: peptide-methionine (S)-S-oxide reductase, partial [Oscillospiraceae bacterium]|nr:peptide-methionine (S)-S-oxide reductase [Oscillospiraceae bacterium]
KDPSYEDVKRQLTGHRETVCIEYDPDVISYGALLDIFLAGVDPYDSVRIVYDLKKLEPLEGAKTVKTYQKWRVALNNTSGYTAQLKAIEAATPSTEAKHITKMKVAHDYGMDLDVYVTLKEWLPEYDENGNGSYSGAEVQAAIDGISGGALIPSGSGYAPGMKLSNKQKAALWQLFTGSKSAKNNPYDIQTGRDIIEVMSDDE